MELIVFCDYGLDDAAATYDLLRHSDEFSLVTLVAIGGNVPPEVSLRNVKKLLSSLDYPLPKNVRIADTTNEKQRYEFLKEIHGGDGMGDLFAPVEESPVKVICFEELLKEERGEYAIISLGPTTLVKTLIEKKKPSKLVLMGGNIASEPNFKGYEFNHALDRSAFTACVKLPHAAITLDTCRIPALNIQERGVKGESLIAKIVNRSRELTFTSGEKGCYIWDDMAVKCFFHPDWFTLEQATDKDGNLLTVAKYILGKPFQEIMEQ